jgi:hypothetical protein
MPATATTATAAKTEATTKVVEKDKKKAQHGGGGMEHAGPGPVIAGALTAVVLAGGLKGFYDILAAQYQ